MFGITIIDTYICIETDFTKNTFEKHIMKKITIIIACIFILFGINKDLSSQNLKNPDINKVFKPIIEKEGLILKFVRAEKNMEGKDFRFPNTVFEINITNTNSDTVMMQNAGVGKGVGSFTEPRHEVRFRIYRLILAPGETGKLFLYVRTDKDMIEELNFSFGLYPGKEEGISFKVDTYNVKVPFEN